MNATAGIASAADVATGPRGQRAHAAQFEHARRFEQRLWAVAPGVWCMVGNGLSNQTFVDAPDGIIAIDTNTYKASRDAAALEVGRVLFEYDLAGYYDDDIAQPLQEALTCYTRAVAYQEWSSLADESAPDPAVGTWANQLDKPLSELRTIDNGQPYGTLLSTDKERADGRRLRLAQSRPAVPSELQWLLLGTSALAVLAIATFTLPYASRRVQIGSLVILASVLGLVQVAIIDLDGKYSGLIQIENTDFIIADNLLAPCYLERFPDQPLPCDERGLRI